ISKQGLGGDFEEIPSDEIIE
nr:Chain D, Crystal structure of thrombin-avathrin complex [Amblyomma variegatum]